MEDYMIRIKTPLWKVGLLLMCVVLELFVLFLPKEDSVRIIHISPVLLISLVLIVISLSLIGIATEWKTVYVGLHEMCICYYPLFFKRKIALDRIHSLDLIIKDGEYTLLFALDSCPSLRNDIGSTTNYKRFVSRHPIKVIFMQCGREEAMLCKQHFDSLQICTDVIIQNPGGTL